jgi:hypothetical protein
MPVIVSSDDPLPLSPPQDMQTRSMKIVVIEDFKRSPFL